MGNRLDIGALQHRDTAPAANTGYLDLGAYFTLPTVVTRSIGTSSRDYSTLQAWEDACPADLVYQGIVWRGECYNDSEFTGSTLLNISGITTDATHNIVLTTGAGHGFRDHGSVLTNPLRYDASKGVGLRQTGGTYAGTVIGFGVNYISLIGLQIQSNSGNGNQAIHGGSITYCTIDSCIIEQQSNGYGVDGIFTGWKLLNSVFIARAASTAPVVQFSYSSGGVFENCTFVAVSDASSPSAYAIVGSAGNVQLTNCAFFGFANVKLGTTTFTFTACASNVASPPSGITGSLTYANQFEGTADATRDFRAKTGANLIGAGTYNANYPTDIVGQTRANPSTIGAWESVSVGPVIGTSAVAVWAPGTITTPQPAAAVQSRWNAWR